MKIMTKAVFSRRPRSGGENELIEAEYNDIPEEVVREKLVENAYELADEDGKEQIRAAYEKCHNGII